MARERAGADISGPPVTRKARASPCARALPARRRYFLLEPKARGMCPQGATYQKRAVFVAAKPPRSHVGGSCCRSASRESRVSQAMTCTPSNRTARASIRRSARSCATPAGNATAVRSVRARCPPRSGNPRAASTATCGRRACSTSRASRSTTIGSAATRRSRRRSRSCARRRRSTARSRSSRGRESRSPRTRTIRACG